MVESSPPPRLERGLNTLHATSLNVANMLGAGPFITIPVLLGTMGSPAAMVGWLVAMVVVMCDGLVWAELGAAFPGSGGTYHYLREVFPASSWGRFLPFLFVWQFLVSGTLEVASGYIAAARFTLSMWQPLNETISVWGMPEKSVASLLASVMAVVIFIALCQRIRSLGWLSVLLVSGVLAAVGTVIVLGALHFDPALLVVPPDAFHVDRTFLFGLGAATGVAVYDYLGYYNVCHLGAEVQSPEKTIPRAVIFSILIVAAIYVLMNLALIGVVPWQEALPEGTLARRNIAGAFMAKLYGPGPATAFTGLIIWTCLAGVFAMTLGYSRIVYAAARNGDFFSAFGTLHSTRGYPRAALALLTILTVIFCFFPLRIVIQGAVTVRIVIQFIGQIFALHLVRREGRRPLPFRMWLYPLPSLVALAGWIFLLATSEPRLLVLTLAVYASGMLAYVVRGRLRLTGGSV